MDLLNLLTHRRSTKFKIEGTIYAINAEGVALDVSDEHAKTLLQSREWKPQITRTAMATVPPPGEVVPQKEVAPLVVPPPGEAAPAGTDPTQSAEAQELPDAGEWPEPTLDMPMAYLKQMADAYELKVPKGAPKEKVIDLIKKAMYSDEKGA